MDAQPDLVVGVAAAEPHLDLVALVVFDRRRPPGEGATESMRSVPPPAELTVTLPPRDENVSGAMGGWIVVEVEPVVEEGADAVGAEVEVVGRVVDGEPAVVVVVGAVVVTVSLGTGDCTSSPLSFGERSATTAPTTTSNPRDVDAKAVRRRLRARFICGFNWASGVGPALATGPAALLKRARSGSSRSISSFINSPPKASGVGCCGPG